MIDNGLVHASGMRILLKGPGIPLSVPNGSGPVSYLFFVDGDNRPIVPIYEPGGLPSPAGPISGAKIVIPGGILEVSQTLTAAELAALPSATSVYAKPFAHPLPANARVLGIVFEDLIPFDDGVSPDYAINLTASLAPTSMPVDAFGAASGLGKPGSSFMGSPLPPYASPGHKISAGTKYLHISDDDTLDLRRFTSGSITARIVYYVGAVL